MSSAHRLADLLKPRGPISRGQFYQLVREGRIKVRKMGRASIVLDRDWQQFLDSLPILDTSNNKAAA